VEAATQNVRDTRTATVVSALVDAELLDPGRRAEAMSVVERVLGSQSTATAPVRKRFAELAGYVGAAFVVSAAAIFVFSQWDDLSRPQQVGLSGGIAVLLAGAGLALGLVTPGGVAGVRRGEEPVRRRLMGVLLTGAAGSAAGAVGLLVDHLVPDHDTEVGLAGFGTLAVLSLLGYVVAPTLVGQVAVATGALASVLVLANELEGDSIAAGLSVLGLGVLWLLATERSLWREVASARVIGCGLALVGAQLAIFESDQTRWVAYLATGLVAVAAFAVYVARPAWPYLATGVIAVTLVVPEALIDWTDNALGPAGGLLVAGVTLLVTSLLGFRLRKEVGDEQAA
jgi:MFS family permease